MELQHLIISFFNTFLVIVFLTIFLIAALKSLKRSKKSSSPLSSVPLPPGPWKLPIIGNLHQMVGPQQPHRRLMNLAKKHGPIMHLQLGETSNVFVSSPELAKEFLKTHDLNFASRPIFPIAGILSYAGRSISFAPHGEYWRQMRKVCALGLLNPKRVAFFRPVMEDEIGKLVASIQLQQQVATNVSRMLISLGNAVVSRAAFGKLQKQEEAFLPVFMEMAEAYGGFDVGSIFPSSKLLRRLTGAERRAQRIHNEADAILQAIVDEHIARIEAQGHDVDEAAEDLVDVLLKYKENQGLGFPFTNVEIKAVISDITLGGSETATTTVAWAMSELMRHPHILEKANKEARQVFDGKGTVDEAGLAELNYLKSVVKETLRLHPPAPLLAPRECQERVVIAGYDIPEKTRVYINVLAIGQDPCYWAEPEQFSPERFLDRLDASDYKRTCFEFIPFGEGRRMCPGILFGLNFTELLLANLLYHFDWQLPNETNPQDLDMSECFGLTVRRKNDLYLIPIPYQPKTV
ncbi:unnamed protein product [Linum trigynum]|uniref:Cytochrome P450 n=1 Tax=Linum trigynum TaxID=586398 RepID=A0AAV2D4L7_9ROSI